ncbi:MULTISPECIES: gas vesicle protein GvpH [unclassified Haladaptatus]|uniref:gas vesicle protein GvpH n=1 Tax=unclassified Haladaptatus TaxID=2622732 RepID=UPI00209C2A09|nr:MULTISPECIES: gas vesicle protein GvpH [unclassified Haladaptatus]MCO8243944.1 hypothetical protein [Haladaptatus sp. AB643]MCO8256479.1 hypothetical protein [Haladaptatus sp. AB618]
MGIIERLVRLANELSDDEKRTYAGEHGSSGGRINYGISLDSVASGHPRKQRSQPRTQPRQRYLTNTREEDGELVVTMDVPGVPKDDLGVTFDGETNVIEIRDDERPIKRFGIEWDDAAIRNASYNNYILELRIGRELPDG